MNRPNLNELATRIHENNKAAGWWDIPRPRVQTAWLVITELAEATEAERAGKYADLEAFESALGHDEDTSWKSVPQKKIPSINFARGFRKHIKDTFEDEIADAVIRLLDFAASEKLDVKRENSVVRPGSTEGAFFIVAYYLEASCSYMANNKPATACKSICRAITELVKIAEQRGFNLWKHVDLKLAYNATRPKMHGKKF